MKSLVFAIMALLAGAAWGEVQAAAAASERSPEADDDCEPDSSDLPEYRIIALTSCTGFVGTQVVRAVRRLYPYGGIRCLVHRNTTRPIDHLADLESVRHVDFLDEQSMVDALNGTTSVYLNTPASDNVREMRQTIASACQRVKGLQHIVMLSEPAEMSWYGLSAYWDDHKAGAEAIERTGIRPTVLHPAFFLDVFPGIVSQDTFNRVGDNPGSFSSAQDVAEVAAKVLVEGSGKHGWKRYTLINEVLTGHEIAEAMSEVHERVIKYVPYSLQEFWQGMTRLGISDKMAIGFTKAMALNVQGIYVDSDRGQLEALLGRRSRSATDIFSSVKHFFRRIGSYNYSADVPTRATDSKNPPSNQARQEGKAR